MRRLRIAAPVQLALVLGEEAMTAPLVWPGMPEQTQTEVLALLARLIARGVVVDEEVAG
ncbi:MAG: hypothetical protein ACREOE_00405 [Gemmatimonadales bacterium]